jgi:hypothetical protein
MDMPMNAATMENGMEEELPHDPALPLLDIHPVKMIA